MPSLIQFSREKNSRKHEWQETYFTSVVRTNLKFDVDEEDWPNAELAIRSSCEGALVDGLPADKVKAEDERGITHMKNLQLYS